MIIPYIKVEQPIGTFYLTSIKASVLKKITEVKIREKDENGIQRNKRKDRIREITAFCNDPDATFPTAVVVGVYSGMEDSIYFNENNTITIDESKVIGEILDGQHRLDGLADSPNIELFDMPVVLMFDLTLEEKAYVFSIINSKQAKINPSLIVDLQEYNTSRSPLKTAHEIAKILNTIPESPFCGRLKMIGTNAEGQNNATLSQGTFASQLLTLFSKNPDEDARLIKRGEKLVDDPNLPLRHYFIDEEDAVILKLMLNCFNAVKNVFPEETANASKSVLWKTTGYSAIIRSFPELYRLGERKGTLTVEFFISVFQKVRTYMETNEIPLTGEQFGGGGKQVQQNLAQWIITATQQG